MRRRTLLYTFLPAFSLLLRAQTGAYENSRRLVARTLEDLRRAARLEQGSKERERYDNAGKHLSDFDREMSQGRFDKDRLDRAIDDVKNIVDHNTLAPRARDRVTRDLADLRTLRETRGARY